MEHAYEKPVQTNSFTLLQTGTDHRIISQDGQFIASANKKNNIIIHKLDNNTEFLITNLYKTHNTYQPVAGQINKAYITYAHGSLIIKIWFSPDNNYIASQDQSGRLIIHNLETKNVVYDGTHLSNCHFCPYSSKIFYQKHEVTSKTSAIISYDLETKKEHVYKYDHDVSSPFCVSHDGMYLACHYKKINEIIITNLETQDFTRIKATHKYKSPQTIPISLPNNNNIFIKNIKNISFGPNNKHLICTHQQEDDPWAYYITVYDISQTEAVFTSKTYASIAIEQVALSQNARYLFYTYDTQYYFASPKSYLVLHDIRTKTERLFTIDFNEENPFFSPDSNYLVFGKKAYFNKEVCVYNLKAKKSKVYRGNFTHKLLTPNNTQLITTTDNQPLCAYNINTGELTTPQNLYYNPTLSKIILLAAIPYGLDSTKIIALDNKAHITTFVKKDKEIKKQYLKERVDYLLDSKHSTKKTIILANKKLEILQPHFF